jgi:hypothetical protein
MCARNPNFIDPSFTCKKKANRPFPRKHKRNDHVKKVHQEYLFGELNAFDEGMRMVGGRVVEVQPNGFLVAAQPDGQGGGVFGNGFGGWLAEPANIAATFQPNGTLFSSPMLIFSASMTSRLSMMRWSSALVRDFDGGMPFYF